MPGTHYAMGFAVSPDGQQVLLLEKNRPAFLAGQWVGLAGHIEPGETPAQAVRREAQEEGNIDTDEWALLGVVDGQANPQDKIFMFAVRTDLSHARALTDEPVQVFSWDEIDQLPLALSTREILGKLREFSDQAPREVPRRHQRL